MKKKTTIFKNRFFSIEGIKREKQNDPDIGLNAINELKMEIFKALRIPQIVEWIYQKMKT